MKKTVLGSGTACFIAVIVGVLTFSKQPALASQTRQVTLGEAIGADAEIALAAGLTISDLSSARTKLLDQDGQHLSQNYQDSFDRAGEAATDIRAAELKLRVNRFDRTAESELQRARSNRVIQLSATQDDREALMDHVLSSLENDKRQALTQAIAAAAAGAAGADAALEWNEDRLAQLCVARRVAGRCNRHGESVPASVTSLIREADRDQSRQQARARIGTFLNQAKDLLSN